MGRLSIFLNELDKETDEQLRQINLALQDVQSWGNRIETSTILDIVIDSADSTTSTAYEAMNGFSANFTNNSPLVRIDAIINIESSGGNADIAIYIDDAPSKQVQFVQTGLNTFFWQGNLRTGKHKVEIKWRVSAGTLTKRASGGNELLVTNLV